MARILTIDHFNHAWPCFLELLHGAGVTAAADVRSAPFSRHVSHFNRNVLGKWLCDAGTAYLFLGGGFKNGLWRVLNCAEKHRIALIFESSRRRLLRSRPQALISGILRRPQTRKRRSASPTRWWKPDCRCS